MQKTNDTTRILAQDETFQEAIQDTRSQFEHRYKPFLENQLSTILVFHGVCRDIAAKH